MEGGSKPYASPPPLNPPSKFSVYQNPALSAALTAKSLRPSRFAFIFIFSSSAASAYALLRIIFREDGLIDYVKLRSLSPEVAYFVEKIVQFLVGLVFVGTTLAFIKVTSLWRTRSPAGAPRISPSKKNNDQAYLSKRQLGLMGIRTGIEEPVSENSRKPPKSRSNLASSPSDLLVPLHQPLTISNHPSRTVIDKSNSTCGTNIHSLSTPSKSPGSASSLYLISTSSPQLSSIQTSPTLDQMVSTPWSNKRSSASKEITTEEKLELFLEDVSEKITGSAGKLATPPPTISGFGMLSPSPYSGSANTSGATRSTPLRHVRMSPTSQKFVTPPKKGDGEFPQPMSIEESIEAFGGLGIYPQIEQWRDRLRQWFSSVLMNPLLTKIENSHIQVMEKAAKLGVSITISQVGSDAVATETPAAASNFERTKEWQPTLSLDEEGLLHQLRATLVQVLESSMPKFSSANIQQSPQQASFIFMIQECIDAITEHQRLLALMKGEWVKGLLPHSSVRADYTVQRIRELAEGTCLKNFEYLRSGEVYDKKNNKWSLELPTDSHLLLYLFCAFLEHPKWMLHVDPASYTGAQSSKNPLFLGVLPPKDRFPEKYVAVISVVPSALHPGAFVLAVGRQSPPVFALYWDKKLQFSLQGRTALWDSILLMCHRIKLGYGGIIRGMHLGSSAISILPVIDLDSED